MQMQWIDGHLDLAYLALLGRDLRVACPDSQAGCVSLPELRLARFNLVFATIFTDPGGMDDHGPASYGGIDDVDGAETAGREQLDIYRQLEAEGELSLVHHTADLAADTTTPKIYGAAATKSRACRLIGPGLKPSSHTSKNANAKMSSLK